MAMRLSAWAGPRAPERDRVAGMGGMMLQGRRRVYPILRVACGLAQPAARRPWSGLRLLHRAWVMRSVMKTGSGSARASCRLRLAAWWARKPCFDLVAAPRPAHPGPPWPILAKVAGRAGQRPIPHLTPILFAPPRDRAPTLLQRPNHRDGAAVRIGRDAAKDGPRQPTREPCAVNQFSVASAGIVRRQDAKSVSTPHTWAAAAFASSRMRAMFPCSSKFCGLRFDRPPQDGPSDVNLAYTVPNSGFTGPGARPSRLRPTGAGFPESHFPYLKKKDCPTQGRPLCHFLLCGDDKTGQIARYKTGQIENSRH